MLRLPIRDRTRSALLAAGRERFGADGFEAVTMADVAAAAGLSRPTAFRYFPSKADLVFAPQDEWYESFCRGADEFQGAHPVDRVEAVALGVAQTIASDSVAVLASYRIISGSPALKKVAAARQRRWAAMGAGLLVPPMDDAEATIAGAAVAALLFACYEAWADDDGRGSLVELTRQRLPLVVVGLRARVDALRDPPP